MRGSIRFIGLSRPTHLSGLSSLLPLLLTLFVAGCTQGPETAEAPKPPVPTWSFEDGEIVPADQGLHRPEDGVALANGTLIIGDQVHGLIALSPDGSHRPFGTFKEIGYAHVPGQTPSAPNGVSLEPDGTHILVADVYTGAIYRVNAQTEDTELLYDHPYGVNTAIRDSTGALWFTQSTQNAGPEADAQLYGAVDVPTQDGALFRIAPWADGATLPTPSLVYDKVWFANGIVIDEENERLFLNELSANRVLAFDVDLETGTVSNQRVLADVISPDNIEMDEYGRLWVASPISNTLSVIDPDTGTLTTAFDPSAGANAALVAEFQRRGIAGEPRLDLLAPELFAPMPGLLTGLILTTKDGPIYVTGLGDAVVKLGPKQ